jgi:hypothetical protein
MWSATLSFPTQAQGCRCWTKIFVCFRKTLCGFRIEPLLSHVYRHALVVELWDYHTSNMNMLILWCVFCHLLKSTAPPYRILSQALPAEGESRGLSQSTPLVRLSSLLKSLAIRSAQDGDFDTALKVLSRAGTLEELRRDWVGQALDAYSIILLCAARVRSCFVW